jgi:hypothetical protein
MTMTTGIYDWICDRKYRAQGIAAVTGAVMWAGAIEGYRAGHRALWAVASDVWVNLRWLADAGTDSWLGPARWAVASGIVMVIWFLGVGVIEYLNRKDDNE